MVQDHDKGRKLKLARKARLHYDALRQEHLLLLPERVVKLNSTGAAIIRLCDGRRSMAEIVRTLQSRYPDANVEPDAHEFLCDLVKKRWLAEA